jgi:hypothetical protein
MEYPGPPFLAGYDYLFITVVISNQSGSLTSPIRLSCILFTFQRRFGLSRERVRSGT